MIMVLKQKILYLNNFNLIYNEKRKCGINNKLKITLLKLGRVIFLSYICLMKNDNEIDLFEHIDTLPLEVQEILEKAQKTWNDDYEDCRKLVAELEAVGYTCEYYLDAVPFNLRKIRK